MSLIKYRDDIRAVAFLAINKSRRKNVILVEGNEDVKFYQNFFDFDIVEVDNAKCDSTIKPNTSSNKTQVMEMCNIIKIIEPHNKHICYLVDKDYSNMISCPPLFVTDYHSLENYILIANIELMHPLEKVQSTDKWQEAIEHYNKSSDIKYDGKHPLKKLHGKQLRGLLMTGKQSWDILMGRVSQKDVPVIGNIKKYLGI